MRLLGSALIFLLAGAAHGQVSEAGLQFDGTTGSVNCGSASQLQFGGTAPFTLEAWIRPGGWLGGDTHRTIISKYNAGSIGAWQFVVRNNNSLGFLRETSPWWLNGNSSVPTNQWRHVAATYDGSTMRIYINGNLDVSESRGFSSTTTSPVLIGAALSSGEPHNRFHGVMDELRVWNIAKSASELQAARNEPITGTEPGLVGYWNMNELTGGGTTLPDLSPSGNDGTLSATGATLVTSDLATSISAPAPSVETGESIVYTINIQNKGPMIAGSTEVTVAFPANFDFESTTLDAEDYTIDGSGLTLDPRDLMEGENINFQLVMSASALGEGTLEVSALQNLADMVPADNTATEETSVVAPTSIGNWNWIVR